MLDDGNTYLRTIADESLGGLALIQVDRAPERAGAASISWRSRPARSAPVAAMIMETVNPQSLYVFARSFYLDPTHVRPVHPGYLEFLFREAGFAEVEIDWRNPPRELGACSRSSRATIPPRGR